MLYHNIMSSSRNRNVSQVVEEQIKENFPNTFYQKVRKTVDILLIDIDRDKDTRKSTWEKNVKQKLLQAVETRAEKDWINKTKCRRAGKNSGDRKHISINKKEMWKISKSGCINRNQAPIMQKEGRHNRTCP